MADSDAAPARTPIAILSYHQVTRVPPRGTPVRTLVLPPWRFRLQLRLLRLLGWRGLSLRDLEPYLRGECTGKVFGITLDDGYLNNYEQALPILLELGCTATAFIVTGQPGGSNVWDHAQGVPPAPLMDVDQMLGWLAAGMEIGAHTRNHVDLRTCDEARARDEIAGSKADLEQWLGLEVRSFSYPYGEHLPMHVDMVRQAGFAMGTTIISSRARPDDDMARLPRISVHLNDSIPLLLAQVTTGYEDWRMQRPGRRHLPTARPAAVPPVAQQPADATTGIGPGVPAP